MNLETKITIYKFTPQLFTLTRKKYSSKSLFSLAEYRKYTTFEKNKAY